MVVFLQGKWLGFRLLGPSALSLRAQTDSALDDVDKVPGRWEMFHQPLSPRY